jgi:NADP-dependent 3-hydroxy acid dehydrogenase YdfG
VSAGVLDGTVALVTGASSGIGEATAVALADQGAAVAIAARRVDRLRALADRIESAGGTALVLSADVTSRADAARIVERTVSELGRLDTLVNNAGMMLLGPVEGAPLEEWERMVHINVLGLLYCAHAALRHLVSAAAQEPRRVADMVNISSVAGRVARRGSGVYNLTKFGVGAFGESFRVSAIEPGAVATELTGHNRPEIQDQIHERFAGIERMRAEDIADAILYVVTRPRHVAINELMLRPSEQAD